MVGFRFETNVTSTHPLGSAIRTPSEHVYAQSFAATGHSTGTSATFRTTRALVYTRAYTLAVCGDLTLSRIESARLSIKATWQEHLNTSDDFDTHLVASDKYADITQLSYVARHGPLLIEPDTSASEPTLDDLFANMHPPLPRCATRSRRTLLDVNVAAASATTLIDYDALRGSLERSLAALRPDLLTNNKTISVTIVSNSDAALDVGSRLAVTKVYAQVRVDNQLLDFYTQNDFDLARLIDELNYQNENNSLVVLDESRARIYSRNYFVTLVCTSRRGVARRHYANVERAVLDVFVRNYEQFAGEARNASALTAVQEEYWDAEAERVVHALHVLVSVDNRPVDAIIELDRRLFDSISEVRVSEQCVYAFKPNVSSTLLLQPSGTGTGTGNTEMIAALQPLAKAFAFFVNARVCRRDYARVEAFVAEAVAAYWPQELDTSNIRVTLVQQDEFVLSNG